MTSLKMIIFPIFLTICAHGVPISVCPPLLLFLAAFGGLLDLQLHFPNTVIECIVLTNSNWLKLLDPDRIKTAEELDVLLLEDS